MISSQQTPVGRGISTEIPVSNITFPMLIPQFLSPLTLAHVRECTCIHKDEKSRRSIQVVLARSLVPKLIIFVQCDLL